MTNTYEGQPTERLLADTQATAAAIRELHQDDPAPAADLLEELAQRLADCQLTQALADEGIGQRAPIALLLAGKDTETNVAVAADAAAELTLNGYIVLEHCPPYGLDDEDTESMHALLRQKIDLADVVNIVNADGIDEALLPFIDHAETTSTPVQYTNPDA